MDLTHTDHRGPDRAVLAKVAPKPLSLANICRGLRSDKRRDEATRLKFWSLAERLERETGQDLAACQQAAIASKGGYKKALAALQGQ